MKIFRGIKEIQLNKKTVVTVGSFDGIHLGHQEILKELNQQSQQNCDCSEILVTFYPHPKLVVGKPENQNLELLTLLNEKLRILEEFGLSAILIIPFTKEFSRTNYRDFVQHILVDKLNVQKIVVGHDHAFGRDRKGHPEQLKQLSKEFKFAVTILEPFYLDGEIVSSSRIRSLIKNGDVGSAKRLLGRHYYLCGIVERGGKRGQQLGYPTANIQLNDPHKLVPKKGVYAVDVVHQNKKYSGMMNIGNRPTFNFDPLTLEVHIFNFSGSIYGDELEVSFKKFIREEKKFNSSEELKAQILKDKKICIKL